MDVDIGPVKKVYLGCPFGGGDFGGDFGSTRVVFANFEKEAKEYLNEKWPETTFVIIPLDGLGEAIEESDGEKIWLTHDRWTAHETNDGAPMDIELCAKILLWLAEESWEEKGMFAGMENEE